MNLGEMADLVKKLRYRVHPDTFEGRIADRMAWWTVDELARTHPTAAELVPHVGSTYALELAERWRSEDYGAVGFRSER